MNNIPTAIALKSSMFDASDTVNYERQLTTCGFPAGSSAGDKQCLLIPIIDNDSPDGLRYFTVSLLSSDEMVRVRPGQNILRVIISDIEEDCKFVVKIIVVKLYR